MQIHLKRLKTIVLVISFGSFFHTASFAQEIPSTQQKPMDVHAQHAPNQMTWEEYKGDVKAKYQKIADEVAKIEKEATEKKIDAPEYKEYLDRFREEANEFNIRMRNADVIPAERRDDFKSEMEVQFGKINTAFEELKSKWAMLNK